MRTKEEPGMTLKTHLLDGRSGLWAARIPDPKERFPEMMERKVAAGGTAKTLLRLIKVTPEGAETLQMTDPLKDVTTFQRKGRRAVVMDQTNAGILTITILIHWTFLQGKNKGPCKGFLFVPKLLNFPQKNKHFFSILILRNTWK